MVNAKRTLSLAVLGLCSVATTLTAQQHYKQTNLVSDLSLIHI